MPTETTQSGAKLDAAYLESLFQGAGLAIVACNERGEIVAWNLAADRLFGGGGALREGGVAWALLAANDQALCEQHVRRCLEAGESSEFRSRLGGTEDDPIEYAVYTTPVLEHDGSTRGVAVWFRDITTRVMLQRALTRQHRLNSLGMMSGAVAHHYNNLLCGIATNLEVARDAGTMAAAKRAIARATESVERATTITQQLLSFAQSDYRTVDLSDLTEAVLHYFDNNEAALSAKNIRVTLDWEKTPSVPVNREHIRIILDNLVRNAVESMSSGGALTVSLSRRDEDSVGLTIADSGGGIPPEIMEHLFEPFHSPRAQLGCGEHGRVGLGLAVVHGLVNEMNGSIRAANVPGRGARFDIVIPIPTSGDEPASAAGLA